MEVQYLLDYRLAGIAVVRWALIAFCVVLAVVVLSTAKRFVMKRIEYLSEKREDVQWLNYVEEMFGRPKLFLYLAVGIYVGLTVFDVTGRLARGGEALAQVLIIIQVGVWATAAGTVVIERLKNNVEDDPAQITALSAGNALVDLVVWGIVALLVLDNLGFDVTALIASLGIGGAAVALASQKFLGDLFAFFAIIVDEPFVRGDFIRVGDLMGTVEKIGIKSTRIRNLDGEEVVWSNESLLDSRIHNFRRMENRRVALEIGVAYDTPGDQLDAIPEVLEQIICDQELVRFHFAYLTGLRESAIEFQAVYAVLSDDIDVHLQVRENVLAEVVREFRRREIELALPTRVVHLDTVEDGGTNPDPRRDQREAAVA